MFVVRTYGQKQVSVWAPEEATWQRRLVQIFSLFGLRDPEAKELVMRV